jgi:hypothetical protein
MLVRSFYLVKSCSEILNLDFKRQKHGQEKEKKKVMDLSLIGKSASHKDLWSVEVSLHHYWLRLKEEVSCHFHCREDSPRRKCRSAHCTDGWVGRRTFTGTVDIKHEGNKYKNICLYIQFGYKFFKDFLKFYRHFFKVILFSLVSVPCDVSCIKDIFRCSQHNNLL